MKLLNRSLLHVSMALLLVLAFWAMAFFFILRGAVRHSIDEGLDDQVEVITHRLKSDSSLLYVHELGLNGFAIAPAAAKEKEHYTDTLLYVPSEGEVERVRLHTGTFEFQDRYHRIQAYTSTVEEDDLVETMAWALIALYVLLLLTIVLVNNVVLRRLWQPFQAMLAQLKSFRLGTSRELPPVRSRTSEFNEVYAAANLLVRRAADAYADQRAFTAKPRTSCRRRWPSPSTSWSCWPSRAGPRRSA